MPNPFTEAADVKTMSPEVRPQTETSGKTGNPSAEKPRFGYRGAMAEPVLVAVVDLSAVTFNADQLMALRRQLAKTFEIELPAAPRLALNLSDTAGQSPHDALVTTVLQAVFALQAKAGLPVSQCGQFRHAIDGSNAIQLLLPIFGDRPETAKIALDGVTACISAMVTQAPIPHWLADRTLERLARTPMASNTPRFLMAASARQIPTLAVAGGVWLFGQGARARWMDSSFTDATPALGARLAKNKVWANQLLKDIGLPVPAQREIKSVQDALEWANHCGYPVVIKPADRDGGKGVSAGLKNPEQVEAAIAAAKQFSDKLLVEQHIEGRDFRLVVLNGELVAAIERVPAGVIGDGKHTIYTLLEKLNADPRRGSKAHALLKTVELNAEALELIAAQGHTPVSVPSQGVFVRLRRTANVGTGGMPVDVLSQVHPDNKALAIRAAAAMRIDLAGIDLLIPDISRSWLEGGAGICEINAQPNMGRITSATLYGEVLKKLVRGNGRIPTVVLLGVNPQRDMASEISAELGALGWRVGVHDHTGVRVAQERLAGPETGVFAAGRMLVLNPQVDAMVLSVQDTSVLQSGMPIDRFDVLFTAASWQARAQKSRRAAALQKELLMMAQLHLQPQGDRGSCARICEALKQVAAQHEQGAPLRCAAPA